MAVLLEQIDATRNQSGIEQGFFGEPDVEMHAEFFEVVAAISQLLGQCVLMNVSPVGAEQVLGVGDQRIEMLVALALGLVIGAPASGRPGVLASTASAGRTYFCAMRGAHLLGHVAHIVALIGIGRKWHGDAVLLQITQPG